MQLHAINIARAVHAILHARAVPGGAVSYIGYIGLYRYVPL